MDLDYSTKSPENAKMRAGKNASIVTACWANAEWTAKSLRAEPLANCLPGVRNRRYHGTRIVNSRIPQNSVKSQNLILP
jgi:hypothetical protein